VHKYTMVYQVSQGRTLIYWYTTSKNIKVLLILNMIFGSCYEKTASLDQIFHRQTCRIWCHQMNCKFRSSFAAKIHLMTSHLAILITYNSEKMTKMSFFAILINRLLQGWWALTSFIYELRRVAKPHAI
jgi:hypothetical protein